MKFVDRQNDRWQALEGEGGTALRTDPAPFLLLSLTQWHALRAQWPHGRSVGVALANDAEVHEIASDLPRLDLVALNFPKWVDGRAYSQARTLRSRHRYVGELRATGEVLVDMLPLLWRTGFDAVVLRADQSLDDAHRALGFFCGHYQGDAANPPPPFAKPPGAAGALAGAARRERADTGAAT
jgi:uncharacterized protein (DUF934 family)